MNHHVVLIVGTGPWDDFYAALLAIQIVVLVGFMLTLFVKARIERKKQAEAREQTED